MWLSTSLEKTDPSTVPSSTRGVQLGYQPTDVHHIVITGAMGVGKTTIGRMLAGRLGLPFLDSDEVLEPRMDETGAEVATREGVDRLHELELEVFLDMCQAQDRSVIAPASSVVDHPKGRSALAKNLTVWLTAPDDVIVARQGMGAHRRPIDAEERAELRRRRSPHLEAVSSIVIDTGTAAPDDVVQKIIDQI